MQIRVRYNFQGRDRDYVVKPLGFGVYNSFEDYKTEVLKWFPDAIVEPLETPQPEIVEFEIVE